MSERLNILMITHFVSWKIFPRSLAMAKELVKRGNQVSLLCISPNERFGTRVSERDGVRLIESPDLLWGKLRSGWDPWDLINRIAYIQHEQSEYDLVHLFETRPITIYPAFSYLRRHNPVLITDWNDWWGHGGIIQENRPRWYQLLFGKIETYYEEAFRTRADGLTVISSALRDRAIRLGVPPEHILWISGGAPLDEFKNRTVEECRQRTGLPQGDLIIGYSSKDAHYELDVMVQTLAEVVRSYPRARLLLTGTTGNAAARVAEKYGVAQNLILTGVLPYPELPWYLGCADVFILPFPNKIFNLGRWPNKIGDYFSLGRPVVTNPYGDVKLVLEQNEVGLFADWDAADFARKIISLYENPELLARMGRNARAYAETCLDWSRLVGRLENFYSQRIAEKFEQINRR